MSGGRPSYLLYGILVASLLLNALLIVTVGRVQHQVDVHTKSVMEGTISQTGAQMRCAEDLRHASEEKSDLEKQVAELKKGLGGCNEQAQALSKAFKSDKLIADAKKLEEEIRQLADLTARTLKTPP